MSAEKVNNIEAVVINNENQNSKIKKKIPLMLLCRKYGKENEITV
jgi:hypothetical protein